MHLKSIVDVKNLYFPSYAHFLIAIGPFPDKYPQSLCFIRCGFTDPDITCFCYL